jgi:hypothetical protein
MFVSFDTRYNERLMVQAQRTRTTPIAESDGVEGNRRLTSITAIPLLGLLFVEGLTVLFGVRQELRIHVFVGMLLVPPIALKLASVGYRFVRYYTGSRAYRLAGPPQWVMRSLGPVVVLSTITLFASGIWLILIGRSGLALTLHKLSFIIWGAVMAVHVLVYARRLPGVVVEEWSRRLACYRSRFGGADRASRGVVPSPFRWWLRGRALTVRHGRAPYHWPSSSIWS